MASTIEGLKALGAHIVKLVQRGRNRGLPTSAAFDAALRDLGPALAKQGAPPDQSHLYAVAGFFWAQSGFPYVIVGQKLAAAIMATDPPTSFTSVHLPWPAFVVEVPDGLFENPNLKGVGILTPVGIGDELYVFTCFANGGMQGAVFRDLDALRASVFDARVEDPQSFLLGRLLIGVILSLNEARQSNKIPTPPAASVYREGRNDAPRIWSFRMTRDVNVDARPWVRAFVASRGKAPSLQALVRGHHKMQPHGPKGALRKWTWVEPYWRGPMDAPIATRSHKVGF